MNLFDGAFETGEENGMFSISITEKSDISKDGGYSFEDVTNVAYLTAGEVLELIKELKCHASRTKEDNVL